MDNKDFFKLLSDSTNRKIFISIFLILTAPLMLMNFLGLYLFNNFNLSQGEVGLAYTLVAIGTILGIIASTALSDRLGKLNMSKFFFSTMVIALIPILLVNNVPLIILFTAIFSFGLDGGWTSYQAFASEVSPNMRGTFMNLFYTVNALTVTFYSIIGSFIFGLGGFKVVVGLGFICSSIAFFIILRLISKD